MTHRPRTKDEIYDDLKSNLTGKIARLTNFTDRSFNYIWNQAFADELQRLEVYSLSSELGGWIDYAGGPITQGDLEELGVEESVDLDELNELVDDEQLDRLVEILGIDRFEGAKATGNVTITTQSDQTDIDKGTVVTTSPDEGGETLRFKTTEDASTANGVTSVSDVSIEAFEVGEAYNVPGGNANTASIVRFESPPLGVRGVYNPDATTGGEERESNEDLRERAKGDVTGVSEGGTVQGIETFIRRDIDVVREGDIIIEEFTDQCPPYVDVIADGGNESDVLDAIDESRPAGIRHNLVRPQIMQVGANIDLLGEDISTTSVETLTEDYLLEKGLGENIYRDDLIREIMIRDDDILNIDFLVLTINNVSNEQFTFSTEIDAAIAYDSTDDEFSDETVGANNDDEGDMKLLPEPASTGDEYYFGSSLPFTEFDLDISTPGAGTWDIVWEYYDGSSWDELDNVTNIDDGTSDFQNGGRNTISWGIPSDWEKTDVDGEVKYFVRARVDSFSALSTYPEADRAFITGGAYRLDYTYDETNGGSITIEDDYRGYTYTKGPSNDYTVEDQTGDGWPETILWQGGTKPGSGRTFSVDYDVTIDATPDQDRYHGRLVRDEINTFEKGKQQTFTYSTNTKEYQLDETPFDDGTVSVSDANNNSYTEGSGYDLISTGQEDRTEDFTYSSGKTTYYLETGVDETTVTIEDEDMTYRISEDFQLIDTDSDGVKDAVDWSIGGDNPGDGTDFTVEYKSDNGLPATMLWRQEIDGAIAFDGGTLVGETDEANNDTADDMTLLPASPSEGGSYFFGWQRPFDSFDINISTAGSGTWNIVWEYYDGSSWTDLSNVTDGTNDFQNGGLNTVSWDEPSDWSLEAIPPVSQELYWVRAKLDDSSISMSQQPLGQEIPISNPTGNVEFTVTYNKKVYKTKHEILETPAGKIDDSSGNTYQEGTDYNIIDHDLDDEGDAVSWIAGKTSNLYNGEEFYITYNTEGDLLFDSREKADPGPIDIEVNNG